MLVPNQIFQDCNEVILVWHRSSIPSLTNKDSKPALVKAKCLWPIVSTIYSIDTLVQLIRLFTCGVLRTGNGSE